MKLTAELMVWASAQGPMVENFVKEVADILPAPLTPEKEAEAERAFNEGRQLSADREAEIHARHLEMFDARIAKEKADAELILLLKESVARVAAALEQIAINTAFRADSAKKES